MNGEPERDLLRRRLLGWGLACGRIDSGLGGDPLGRDLRLADGPDGRDLAAAGEIENLGQSLQIALTTRLGDDVFNAGFGFDGLNALVEETNPVLVRERVRVAVIQVLRRDPRIRRIVDVQLQKPSTASTRAADGEPSSNGRLRARTLDVQVVFETLSGDELSVDLTGGVAGG